MSDDEYVELNLVGKLVDCILCRYQHEIIDQTLDFSGKDLHLTNIVSFACSTNREYLEAWL